jgi:hypothetical protein
MAEGCKQAAHDYWNWYGWVCGPTYGVHSTMDGRVLCDCKTGVLCGQGAGKHPILSNWNTDVAQSGADIEAMFEPYPNANVHIVTGQVSKLLVVDVDVDKGGGESYRRLWTPPEGTFRLAQPTRRHGTGGSKNFHDLYRLPDGVIVKSGPLKGFKGIDIRGEGGNVLAPPSVTSKGTYRNDWHDPANRAGSPPGWLLESILQSQRGMPDLTVGAAAGPGADAEPVDRSKLPEAVERVMGDVPDKGERSDVFYRLVCLCKEHGLTEGQAVTLAREWCDAQQDPPSSYLHPRDRVAEMVRLVWLKHRAGLVLDIPATSVPGYVPGAPEPATWGSVALDPERAAEVVEHPARAELLDEMFPELDFYAIWETLDDPPDWVWEPFMERENSMAFYSRGGTGKSLFVLEGVAALCTGGIPPGATASRAPIHVAYVDRENPRKSIGRRLRAMGYKPSDFLPYLHYYRFPMVPPLDTPYGGQLFVEQMFRVGVELVVLDTTGKYLEGDEDKAATINNLDRYSIQPLTREGIAVLRIDHTGKDPTKGQRGSSAKEAIGDGAYFISREGEVLTFTATKLREEISPEEIVFMRHRNPTRHTVLDETERARLAEEMQDSLRDEHVERLVEVMLENGIRNRFRGQRRAETALREALEGTDVKFSHDKFKLAYIKLASVQEPSDEDD